MAKTIVITSGKGGVGKTTLCANLGNSLASLGFRVVLVDVDIGLNNLDVIMGVENQVVFDLTDVIENKCRTKQALIQDFNQPSLYIMPSAHAYNKSCITATNIRKVIKDLETYFDVVLVDCPAGIDEPFKRAIAGCNEAMVVVTPHVSSMRDADKVITLLKANNIKTINLIINRMRGDMMLDKDMLPPDEIESILSTPLIGVVPEDDKVSVSSMFGCLLQDNSEAYQSINLIAQNLKNGTRRIYDCSHKYKGIFGRVKRAIKRRV